MLSGISVILGYNIIKKHKITGCILLIMSAERIGFDAAWVNNVERSADQYVE
jgi:hypothetical protein